MGSDNNFGVTAGELQLGRDKTSDTNATYNYTASPGGAIKVGLLTAGRRGKGTFHQNAGDIKVDTIVTMASQLDDSVTGNFDLFTHDAGNLNAGTVDLGAGGAATRTGNIEIGNGGKAVMTHTGG